MTKKLRKYTVGTKCTKAFVLFVLLLRFDADGSSDSIPAPLPSDALRPSWDTRILVCTQNLGLFNCLHALHRDRWTPTFKCLQVYGLAAKDWRR
jgi:hypothetical protein